jgi:RNA methyltransferase, TrmH family
VRRTPLADSSPITSRDNVQYKALRKLAGSGRERRKSGLTLLEGLHLIEAWRSSGRDLQKIVLSAAGAARREHAHWLAAHPQLPLVVLADSLFGELAEAESPTGILAVVAAPLPDRLPRPDLDSVVLDGVQDPGNVGTILRSAAAAGFRQALLTGDCAQAWSGKTLRAGMGAHFAIDVFEAIDAVGFLASFEGTVAVTQLEATVSLYSARLVSPIAWVFGHEGEGVRPAVAATSNLRVRIPMPGAVESLNVGAAAAVCLFETVRQRLANPR